MSAYTPDVVIKAYRDTRDEIDVITERHKAELAPYQEKLEKLAAWLLGQLNAQKVKNFKTDYGTAFKVERAKIKADDPDMFHQFVLENAAWEMVKLTPITDPVKDYTAEHHGNPPPGLSISYDTTVQIRRA